MGSEISHKSEMVIGKCGIPEQVRVDRVTCAHPSFPSQLLPYWQGLCSSRRVCYYLPAQTHFIKSIQRYRCHMIANSTFLLNVSWKHPWPVQSLGKKGTQPEETEFIILFHKEHNGMILFHKGISVFGKRTVNAF